MPQVCVTDGCKHTSRVVCDCCDTNRCLEHLQQHNESINAQLNPLADQVNTLSAQLITLKAENIADHYRQQLDQWRDDCCTMINQFYEKKCDELDRRCNQRMDFLKEEIDQIRSKICKLMNEQEIASDDLEIVRLNLRDTKRQMIQLKEKALEIICHPLIIDEKLISIEETKIYQLDLSKFSIPYRNLPCTNQSWPSMTINDHYLLVDQYPNLNLFNHDLKLVKQFSWSDGSIRDMCWSATSDSFIIINNEKDIFRIKNHSLTIERIQTIEEQYWWSCTCSSTSLFLTNTTMGTNIFEFNLLASCQFIQRWKPPYSCKQHEYIDDIQYNNGTLALVIKVSSTNTVHLELRSSITLERLWSIQLDIRKSWFQQTIRCCSLRYDQWLVVEGNTSHLFHILQNGQMKIMKEYKPSPVNAVRFNTNILVIRTKKNILFHRL